MKIDKIPPVFLAGTVQLAIFGGMVLVLPLVDETLGYQVPFFWQMLAQGVLAAVGTHLLGLSYWWVIIQVCAPPLLVLALAVNMPVWVFPLVLILLVMNFWNVVVNRVPLYLTNQKTAAKLETFLPKREGLRVVDLGSGLGGTMRELAGNRPGQAFFGYETAPFPFLLSWLFARLNGTSNVSFRFQNFWKTDLSEFDVVYCFLSPVPMPALYEKAVAEMKPGSLFISNSFTVPRHKPHRTLTVNDGRKTKLMVWKL